MRFLSARALRRRAGDAAPGLATVLSPLIMPTPIASVASWQATMQLLGGERIDDGLLRGAARRILLGLPYSLSLFGCFYNWNWNWKVPENFLVERARAEIIFKV